ncbi:MAG: tetratricopeptide repeat protein [Ignavibacteriales bacterium]|nr:tetratricopeptide repeat protein [Ignavibacteriales bacterium]MCF8315448.1 tetratricopeptide repeat protein [Ignavibacteriales bacterium]MCF8437024.1 tetratricopeptide repeat protein [Ignavibacteriales bacterium]
MSDAFDKMYENGLSLYDNGDYVTAVNYFFNAYQINPGHIDCIGFLADCLFKLEALEDSLKFYNMLIEQNIRDPFIFFRIGLILQKKAYETKNKTYHQRAIKSLETAIQMNPEYTDAYYEIGREFYELGDHQDAYEAFQAVLRQDNTHAAACSGIGDIFLGRGDTRSAIEWYKKGVAVNKSYKPVITKLVDIYLSQGDIMKAHEYWQLLGEK